MQKIGIQICVCRFFVVPLQPIWEVSRIMTYEKKRLWRFVLANWNLANFKVFTQNITAQDAPNVYICTRVRTL